MKLLPGVIEWIPVMGRGRSRIKNLHGMRLTRRRYEIDARRGRIWFRVSCFLHKWNPNIIDMYEGVRPSFFFATETIETTHARRSNSYKI